MRVVLDTNVLISALISPDGTPARVIRAWIANTFLLISHEEQLGELRNVTRRTTVRHLGSVLNNGNGLDGADFGAGLGARRERCLCIVTDE